MTPTQLKCHVHNEDSAQWHSIHIVGLSLQEAGKLQYYFHFRKPILLTHKTLLQRANLDSSIDFMDNIEEDTPAGWLCLISLILNG